MKKALLSVAFFVVIFSIVGIARTKAGILDNVSGWIWGGTEEQSDGNPNNGNSGYETGIGWISTNRIDCDINNDGTIDASEFAANSNCPAAGTNVSDYGMNVPANGTLWGYAWSSNLGWISFNDGSMGGSNDLTGCPAAACAAASHGNSAKFTGWARILGIKTEGANAGGWSGWISLSNLNCDANDDGQSNGTAGCPVVGTSIAPYGVTEDAAGNLSGYAWSDELGWISFRGTGVISYGAASSIPSVTFTGATPPGFTLSSGQTYSPQSTTLSWTTSGNVGTCNAYCLAGPTCDSNWTSMASAALAVSSGSKAVTVNSTTTYGIHCTGIATDATLLVGVGCNPKKCQATSCVDDAGSFLPATSYDAVCLPASTCLAESDCMPRNVVGWKEVAP